MTHIDDELYAKIVRQMPIPCVDVLATRASGEILLVKRNNPPAQGEWWLPGGRILFCERRVEAARRKLLEECGLRGIMGEDLGTFDFILLLPDGGMSHVISTVIHMGVVDDARVVLDAQSSDYRWCDPNDWQPPLDLADTVRAIFTRLDSAYRAPR